MVNARVPASSENLEELRCAVCSELYGSGGVREPVALPRCGHTFCRLCLHRLQELNPTFRCPACRRLHAAPPVRHLPTNYIVIHLLESHKEVREAAQDERQPWLEPCRAHGDPQLLWCCQCSEQLCGQCLVEQHMTHAHKILKLRSVIEGKKQKIVQQASLALRYAEKDKNLLTKEVENIAFQLVDIYKKSRAVDQRLKEAEGILRAAAACHDVHALTRLEEVLRLLQTEDVATRLTEPRSDGRTVTSSDEYGGQTLPGNKYKRIRRAATHSLEEWEASGHDPPKWSLTQEVAGGGRHWPRFSWPRFIAQLAAVQLLVPPDWPEVFLRLGVGVRELGCVHILLWGHLRRAQHFLALCLGTLGPCYRGATFRSVERRGEPGESLRGGDYLSASDAFSSCQGVMQDLEWGGDHAGPVKQGFVGGGGGGHHESDALFNICLKDKPGGKMSCPFGQVVSGMDVVRAATLHHPLTEVLIMDVGLHLPDHHSCIADTDP